METFGEIWRVMSSLSPLQIAPAGRPGGGQFSENKLDFEKPDL